MSSDLFSTLDRIIDSNKRLLLSKIEERRAEMGNDNTDHLMLYQLLGISEGEGKKIDLYQNVGRFLYKYAGALIEDVTKAVLYNTKAGESIQIPNTVSRHPVNFEIDCFVKRDNRAHEIKWRDATTDGDHIKKEHDKVTCIQQAGMIPIRVMYFMPNRSQAITIQERIIAAYRNSGGEAYVGAEAWQYIRDYTGIDLQAYLERKLLKG